ncbi:uncharacterized protein LOC127598335 [Hippocampus zosterae]|uniref:uncharacterized protein LOC127598335 n=1 Tax=Hippocampus zosterae TaxID=109293 RepID=UPI00223D959C|nr:uncharacterized protein LOC127598335 [Hippocampus zosterae]
MENIRSMVLFLLGVWLFITRRRQALFERRLQAARRNTEEKMRRVWELLEDDSFPRPRRRRQMMLHLLLKRRRRPSIWAVRRSNVWWDQIVPGFTHQEWVRHFRMSEETFLDICAELRPAMEKRDTNFRACVPLKKRVAIALWKLATNSEYRSISHLFGVSETTVCRCLREFCSAACALLLPRHVRFPDPETLARTAAEIEASWGLPRCVGAIQGSHIPIIAPQENHRDYINARGWHSIILQGVVDGKGLFWSTCAGMAGGLRHARALRESPLWEMAEQGRFDPSFYILGDSAYPLKPWLLKAFRQDGALTPERRAYNESVRSARATVRAAFSRLKGRWRCLTKRNDGDIRVVKSMVLTCCALHNICERHAEEYRDQWDTPALSEMRDVDDEEDEEQEEEEGGDVRDSLVRFLTNVAL